MISPLRKVLLLVGCGLLAHPLAASAPAALADVIYHEHYRGNYDPGEEDTALRADGSALSYLRILAARFSDWVRAGGEGSFTYTKTGANTAELSITDHAGKVVTRTLTFVTDTGGTWSSAAFPGDSNPAGRPVEQTFSLRPLYPAFPVLNSSSRTSIGPGKRSIFGFVVAGEQRQVLIRVVGPGLKAFGVSPVAEAPVLELFSSDGVLYARSTRWDDDLGVSLLEPVFRLVGAFPLVPGSADAATLVTLKPGSYTVQASTAGTAGEVLTEVYVLP